MRTAIFVLNQELSFALVVAAWWLAHNSALHGGYLGKGFAIIFAAIGIVHAAFLLFRFTGTDLAVLTVVSKAIYLVLMVALINVRSRESQDRP